VGMRPSALGCKHPAAYAFEHATPRALSRHVVFARAHRNGRPLARPAVGSRGRRRRAPDPLALLLTSSTFWLLS
jgi:hypothetical protein